MTAPCAGGVRDGPAPPVRTAHPGLRTVSSERPFSFRKAAGSMPRRAAQAVTVRGRVTAARPGLSGFRAGSGGRKLPESPVTATLFVTGSARAAAPAMRQALSRTDPQDSSAFQETRRALRKRPVRVSFHFSGTMRRTAKRKGTSAPRDPTGSAKAAPLKGNPARPGAGMASGRLPRTTPLTGFSS